MTIQTYNTSVPTSGTLDLRRKKLYKKGFKPWRMKPGVVADRLKKGFFIIKKAFYAFLSRKSGPLSWNYCLLSWGARPMSWKTSRLSCAHGWVSWSARLWSGKNGCRSSMFNAISPIFNSLSPFTNQISSIINATRSMSNIRPRIADDKTPRQNQQPSTMKRSTAILYSISSGLKQLPAFTSQTYPILNPIYPIILCFSPRLFHVEIVLQV